MHLVAVGVLGNQIDSKLVQSFLREIAERGYSLTFFHPVRIFPRTKIYSSILREPGSLREFVETAGSRILERDVEKFIQRLKTFRNRVTPPSYRGLIRVVLHTEYSVPLWCNETFRNMYLESIGVLVRQSRNILRGCDHKVLVEVHPGFTELNNCKVRFYRNDIVVDCEGFSDVERNPRRFRSCLGDFIRKAKEVADGEGEEVGFCLEPRAGSAVRVNGVYQSQTLDDHYVAALFAESLGMGLVLDPGQTVRVRIGEKEVWNELQQVGSHYADIVEEIHVHSVKARVGSPGMRPRYHVHPGKDELESFARLIHHILEHRRKPIGVVYEVIGGERDIMVSNVQYLLNILNQTNLQK